jgi:hypothetical protein
MLLARLIAESIVPPGLAAGPAKPGNPAAAAPRTIHPLRRNRAAPETADALAVCPTARRPSGGRGYHRTPETRSFEPLQRPFIDRLRLAGGFGHRRSFVRFPVLVDERRESIPGKK